MLKLILIRHLNSSVLFNEWFCCFAKWNDEKKRYKKCLTEKVCATEDDENRTRNILLCATKVEKDKVK